MAETNEGVGVTQVVAENTEGKVIPMVPPKPLVVPEQLRPALKLVTDRTMGLQQLRDAHDQLNKVHEVNTRIYTQLIQQKENELKQAEFRVFPALGWEPGNLPTLDLDTWEYKFRQPQQ